MGIETAIIGATIAGVAAAGASSAATLMNKPPEVKEPKPQKEPEVASRDRQRRRALGAYGRGDTILTGPMGDVGTAPGQAKTMLGA